MKRLTDDMLIEVYMKAKELKLEEAFIALVEQEMERRALAAYPEQGGREHDARANRGPHGEGASAS